MMCPKCGHRWATNVDSMKKVKVVDLKSGDLHVDIELEIIEKSGPREVEKNGESFLVADAVGKDETGEIAVILWRDDAINVLEGDKIRIKNGFVRDFDDKLELSAGKYGKLKVS